MVQSTKQWERDWYKEHGKVAAGPVSRYYINRRNREGRNPQDCGLEGKDVVEKESD